MKFRYLYAFLIVILLSMLIVPVAFAQDTQPPTPPVVTTVDESNPIGATVSLLDANDLKRTGLVLFLVFGNFLAATLVSISQRRFDAKKLPDFFIYTLIPFVGGLILFQAFLHVLSATELLEALFGKDFSAQFGAAFDASFLWASFGAILISVGVSFVKNITTLISVIAEGSKNLAKLGKGASTPSE